MSASIVEWLDFKIKDFEEWDCRSRNQTRIGVGELARELHRHFFFIKTYISPVQYINLLS